MGRTRSEIIYYNKGRKYCNQGNFYGALDCFSKAINKNSDFSKALIFKGMVHFALGQYDDSLLCDNDAIGINKGNSWAWCNKGISLLKLGRVNDALDAAIEATKYAERNSNSWGIKGDCQFALGQYNCAIESYTKAIELKPDDACNYIGKGESLLSLQEYNEALKYFDEAIKIEKENAEAWLNKGNVFFKQGMEDEALKCLDQALYHNPNEGKALYIKALVFTSQGKEDNARSCFDESRKKGFDPEKTSIVDRGRILKILIKGTNVTPDEGFIHEEMQMLLLKLGIEMGFNVWIAKNDKGKAIDGKRFKDINGILIDLPHEIEGNVKNIIELIDVLWLEGNTIKAAFEVESTTAIYSGLLRLSDLILAQPDNGIDLYIVAPDERHGKVIDEINRLTFSKLGLKNICYYIPFSKLREEVSRNYKILKYLKTDYIKKELSQSLV
jgi:Tfp pilus assembly protein PilF